MRRPGAKAGAPVVGGTDAAEVGKSGAFAAAIIDRSLTFMRPPVLEVCEARACGCVCVR